MTRNSSLALAATAFTVTLALAWQALTVGANYHGDWTALFCTGDRFATPPALRSEHIYRFHSSLGYDGQFYHYIAHDPWQRRGFSAYIDAPLLRYTRILVPALASFLALGGDKRIDRSYVAAILLFTGLGSYWLGMYSAHFGRSPLWGISFLLVPAVLISLDRMVIDGSLAALSVGWAWYNTRERHIALWFVLAAAALARETGFILIAVQVLWLFRNSRYRASFGMAASAMPALMW